MRHLPPLAAVSALVLLAASPGTHAASQTSIAELLKQGYEVKATSVISLPDSKATNDKLVQPQILVTLQKGPSLAVCQYHFGNWANIATGGAASFTNTSTCDVVP